MLMGYEDVELITMSKIVGDLVKSRQHLEHTLTKTMFRVC